MQDEVNSSGTLVWFKPGGVPVHLRGLELPLTGLAEKSWCGFAI